MVSSIKVQFMTWHALNVKRDDAFKLEYQDIDRWFSSDALRLYGHSGVDVIQKLSERISEIESFIRKKAKEDWMVKRLREIYGIGPILGWMIRYETGSLDRFHSVKNFLSYCGLVDSVKLSNNKVKGHNNSKNRNKFLRWAFAEAAVASLTHPDLKRFHDRLVRKKGPVKAKAIVSSKMARVAFRLMKEPDFQYDQNKLFGF